MKYRKTPQTLRGTYKLYDDDGRFITEYKPGKDGITEVDILNLHRIDDHEVYVNGKEIALPEWYKPIHKDWVNKWINDFEKKYGYKPNKKDFLSMHRTYEYIDDQTTANGDELGDSSWLEAELAVYDDADESDAVTRLNEIITAMPEKWQQVYRLFYLEEHNKTQIGKILGVSDSYVGQLVRKIEAKIANDEVLKKIYR